MDEIKIWDVGLCFQPTPRPAELEGPEEEEEESWALLILNQPLFLSLETFTTLWNKARWRIVADGGANMLYDHLGSELRGHYIPEAIRGDLDSARPEVLDYYASQGCKISRSDDQDTTDFQKSIQLIEQMEGTENTRPSGILALGALTGRIDHLFHSLHILYLYSSTRDIYLLSDTSIVWLLNRGKHIIWIDERCLGLTCGIAPIGIQGANITTRGLKWDLDHAWSSFGGLVSTSNIVVGYEEMAEQAPLQDTALSPKDQTTREMMSKRKKIMVTTDAPVLWTIELSPS
ncbi:MAG: thiamine pyrophosphokinase [Piptocephalis tieghemiana]|nr:MAG: thiamine pyrophosphokinase [Piptocephalis tieghemiana]